ncbi:MAG: DNA polymerase IV, partial [Promethearchaeota archaeon]
DIIKTPLNKIIKKFGKYGEWIWKIANGLDKREVKEFHEDRKSISKERTFFEDTDDFKLIFSKLDEINNKIHKKLEDEKIYYRTITLKIRLRGFLTYTRSKSFSYHILNKDKVLKTVLELLNEFLRQNKKVRLVGIKLSNLKKDINVKQTNLINFVAI